MRPGKQLFPLNYNNIINNKEIKYNIKAIKLLIRETYGGNRTYINQIMFFEQSAEEVKDLLCSNDLNKYYKLNKKNIKQNIIRNNYNTGKNTLQKNKTQILKYNNNIIAKKNSKKKIKNKTFEEKQEQNDMYNLIDITNGKEKKNNNKKIEITPTTKMPNRQIKTDIKIGSKKIQKKLNLNKNNNENLTPNKYLKRLKNINKGNNTSNYSNHNIEFINNFGLTLKDNHSHIKQNLENNTFNTSANNKSENNNMNNFEEEELPEESQKNSKIYQLENELKNDYYTNNYNNKTNSEYKEENDSTFVENRQKLYKTHQNINYNKRNNNIFNNLINMKSDNNSSIFTEQNQNEISYNNNSNNNNYSQRYSIVTINNNYNNIKKQRTNLIKQKLDYLEGNILEIKKTLQEISEGFAFCVSKEFIINNFREQIISICEEIYNEYYQNNISKNNNTNIINEKNGNDSLMTNSNYISQNNENNKQLEIELENQINQKLDEKLGTLQNNIFDKYLKPTINKIGNSMKKNMEQIQLEVDGMGGREINEDSKEKEIDLSYKLSTSKVRNEKFEEINKIGERLYNKLLEKEKKLKILKEEKAKFLDEEEDE